MLDINGGEIIVLLVLAVVLIGPERLPRYAAQLAALVRRGKGMLQDAKARVDDELGPELKDVDWSKLDPRQYDPRRIVREALMDDDPVPTRAAGAGVTAAAATASSTHAASSTDEATPTNGASTTAPGAGGQAGTSAGGRPDTSADAAVSAPAPFDDEAT